MFEQGRLRYSSSVGTLGSSGKLKGQDDRDVFRFQSLGDFGRFTAAHDDGRGSELGGQIERPVNLVA